MAEKKTTVLITGCSDGSAGAALAIAFDKAGYHVYATSRDTATMKELNALGIETLGMDNLSEESIAACVKEIPSLDMLVNNAGSHYLMPVVDTDIAMAKKIYDLNVWSHVAVTQAFLTLLLKSKGTIVNHTSVGASVTLPFQGVYNSSKAALAKISDSLRLELQPFGVKVIDLRSAVLQTNLIKNVQDSGNSLPEGSIYEAARNLLSGILRQEQFVNKGMPAEVWAEATVRDLSRKAPKHVIWRGEGAFICWILWCLPVGWGDVLLKKASGLDVVAKALAR